MAVPASVHFDGLVAEVGFRNCNKGNLLKTDKSKFAIYIYTLTAGILYVGLPTLGHNGDALCVIDDAQCIITTFRHNFRCFGGFQMAKNQLEDFLGGIFIPMTHSASPVLMLPVL